MIFDDGIHNDFEKAHQKGLERGFDLGWTYKGEFDRSIITDQIYVLEKQYNKVSDQLTFFSSCEELKYSNVFKMEVCIPINN